MKCSHDKCIKQAAITLDIGKQAVNTCAEHYVTFMIEIVYRVVIDEDKGAVKITFSKAPLEIIAKGNAS
jgi:hypothetical protein